MRPLQARRERNAPSDREVAVDTPARPVHDPFVVVHWARTRRQRRGTGDRRLPEHRLERQLLVGTKYSAVIVQHAVASPRVQG
jgi:hypothetical protein